MMLHCFEMANSLSLNRVFMRECSCNTLCAPQPKEFTMSSTPNKIAIITGGSRGLGRASAIALAKTGVGIVLTYQHQRDAAQAVVEQIQAGGGNAIALQLDVGQIASITSFSRALATALPATFQRSQFDYLINNAGMGTHAALADTTEAQFDALMNVHLKGAFFLTQALLPMIADGGRILNISTGLTRFAIPGYGAYAAMKGAMEVLTRYWAKELGARQIAVNTLAPGAIETDFGGGAVRDNAQINAYIAGQTALGRVGVADDIGPAVASLLSDANRWVNAQRVEVSGGMFV
jgi:NAD(P)-dependent dehydrogenase (short-subunit alcohol dehydrogenase family)